MNWIYHSHFVTNAISKAVQVSYHCLTSVVALVKFTSPWRPSIVSGFCPETTVAVAKAASTKVPTGRIDGRRVAKSRSEEDVRVVLEKAFALLSRKQVSQSWQQTGPRTDLLVRFSLILIERQSLFCEKVCLPGLIDNSTVFHAGKRPFMLPTPYAENQLLQLALFDAFDCGHLTDLQSRFLSLCHWRGPNLSDWR